LHMTGRRRIGTRGRVCRCPTGHEKDKSTPCRVKCERSRIFRGSKHTPAHSHHARPHSFVERALLEARVWNISPGGCPVRKAFNYNTTRIALFNALWRVRRRGIVVWRGGERIEGCKEERRVRMAEDTTGLGRIELAGYVSRYCAQLWVMVAVHEFVLNTSGGCDGGCRERTSEARWPRCATRTTSREIITINIKLVDSM
jgi:hypothetical protein